MSQSSPSLVSEKNLLRLIALVSVSLVVHAVSRAVLLPLQLDEFATWWVVQRDMLSAIVSTAPYNPHPLYYGLEWLTTRALGESTQALRALSYVSFAVMSVLLVRFLKRRYGLNWQLGVALLATMGPVTTLINARPYQLGFLFSLGAMAAASKGLHLVSSFGAFLLCSLAFLTHQSFIIAFVVPIAFYLLQPNVDWMRRARWVALFGLAALLFTLTVRALFSKIAYLESASEQFYFVFDFLTVLTSSQLLSRCILGNLLIAGVFIAWQRVRGDGRATIWDIVGAPDFKVGVVIIVSGLTIVGALSVIAGHSLFLDRYMLTLLIGNLLMIASILRTIGRYEVVGVLLTLPCVVLALQNTPRLKYDRWEEAVSAGRSPTSNERILSIVYAGHPLGRFPHLNLDAQMSSAWTCPVDYYAPQSDSNVTLPMVEGALNPSDPSRYRLPWTSVELKSFQRVELIDAGWGKQVIGKELATIRRGLAQNCFIKGASFTEQSPFKYQFRYDPSRCIK
jgi:hypothetical protein